MGAQLRGFMTLQALNTDPELWRCGINVAGVVDWATYGAGYTTPRLGTPVENPENLRHLRPGKTHGSARATVDGDARHQRHERCVSRIRSD